MSAALRVNDLVARINEIIGEDINLAISRAELQNPTPKIVEALIYQFLMEFQHSDFMNQGHPIIEMKMGDLLTNDIKETLHLDILVVAARKFFERIEFRDYSFGIMDIVNPQPKVSTSKLYTVYNCSRFYLPRVAKTNQCFVFRGFKSSLVRWSIFGSSAIANLKQLNRESWK